MPRYKVKWLRVAFGMVDYSEAVIDSLDLGQFINSLINDACIILKVSPTT